MGCLPLGALRGASCCGSSEMSHVIPRHVFQTLKSHRWNCNVLGRCRKFGHPNYVRLLVNEAPKANSCVRSSSHDTAHDPRDASNTTPTPHNAKSRKTGRSSATSPTMLPPPSGGSRPVRVSFRPATTSTRPSRGSRHREWDPRAGSKPVGGDSVKPG